MLSAVASLLATTALTGCYAGADISPSGDGSDATSSASMATPGGSSESSESGADDTDDANDTSNASDTSDGVVPPAEDTFLANPYANAHANYYAGQTHAHATGSVALDLPGSDGRFDPQTFAEQHYSVGYDWLALSDHRRVTDAETAVNVPGMLLINGIEQDVVQGHLIAFGVTHEPPFGMPAAPDGDLREAIDEAALTQNAITYCAHPGSNTNGVAWKEILLGGTTRGSDLCDVDHLMGTAIKGSGDIELWDGVLTTGRRFWGFANTDAHVYADRTGQEPYIEKASAGYIVVNAPSNTKVDILDNVRAGNFYFVRGAGTPADARQNHGSAHIITVSVVDDKTVVATTSAPATIEFVSDGAVIESKGDAMHHEYTVTGDETYVRVVATISDTGGNNATVTAFSQPIFVTSKIDTDSACPLDTEPTLTREPKDAEQDAGKRAYFKCQATGSEPLTFQWFRNGSAIAGATMSAYFTDPLAQNEDGDEYFCRATNQHGSDDSGVVTLTVRASGATDPAQGPYFTSDLDDITATAGSTVEFEPEFTGLMPRTERWTKNGVPVQLKSNASDKLKINNVSAGDHCSRYRMQLTNPLGQVVSREATLRVSGQGPCP